MFGSKQPSAGRDCVAARPPRPGLALRRCPKAFSPTSQRSPKGPKRKAPSHSSAIPFNHGHEPATRTGVSSRGAQSRRRLGSFVELPVAWLEPGSMARVRLSPELGTGLGGGWALGAGFLHHQRDISARPGQAVVFHRVSTALLSPTATPELLVSDGRVSLLACTRSHALIFQRSACLALSSLGTDRLPGVAVAVTVVARGTKLSRKPAFGHPDLWFTWPTTGICRSNMQCAKSGPGPGWQRWRVIVVYVGLSAACHTRPWPTCHRGKSACGLLLPSFVISALFRHLHRS